MPSRLVALLLLLAGPALAWPVDLTQDVELGREKFIKLPALDFFDVADRTVVDVEWMADSGELLLSGKKAGHALVLLGAQGKVAVWRVRVGEKPKTDPAAWKAAEKACADFRATPLDKVKLSVTVQNEACRGALLTLFQTDAFEARTLRITYDRPVLQQQLKTLEARFEKLGLPVKATYVGAGLALSGRLTVAQHHQVLWEVFRHSLGRLPLDDSIVETDASRPDAGAEEK